MNVNVLLFAEAKVVIGTSSIEVALPVGASVRQLRHEISQRFPTLHALLGRSAVAVNQRFVDDATTLSDQDEIAWIPPVSGG